MQHRAPQYAMLRVSRVNIYIYYYYYYSYYYGGSEEKGARKSNVWRCYNVRCGSVVFLSLVQLLLLLLLLLLPLFWGRMILFSLLLLLVTISLSIYSWSLGTLMLRSSTYFYLYYYYSYYYYRCMLCNSEVEERKAFQAPRRLRVAFTTRYIINSSSGACALSGA